MSTGATKVNDEFKSFLLRMADAFQAVGNLRNEERDLRDIAESLDQPFTVAVFGRMKTGKSSIINALVGQPLTITGVEEATATINWISFGDASQRETAVVYWKNRQPEPVPLARISDWAGKSPEVLERVRNTAFLKLFHDDPFLRNIHIVDTPGTDSVVDEHEKIAREFLSPRAAQESEAEGKKADALLYVFSHEGLASDQETLEKFRETRLPGSDPYNSIGVLHLWDALEVEDVYSEAHRKAEKLLRLIGDVVSDVIPVSAPLALVARNAPDRYFEELLKLTTNHTLRDELLKNLKKSDRWVMDDTRRLAYQAYGLPWASFVRVIRLFLDYSCDSVAEARAICLRASGFEELQTSLQNRFFKRAALIKQRLTRLKAKRPIELGLMKLNEHCDQIRSDLEHFSSLLDANDRGGPHHAWLAAKVRACRQQFDELEAHAEAADRQRLLEGHRMNLIEGDLAFLEAMHHHPDWIKDRDKECIRGLLAIEDDRQQTEPPSRSVIEAMLNRYAIMLQSPERAIRNHFEHLILRLKQSIHDRGTTCS